MPDRYGHFHQDYQTFKVNPEVCTCGGLSEIAKAWLAFGLLVIAMVLNLFVLSFVHELVPLEIKRSLPDISNYLPKYDGALDYAEYIIVILSVLLVLMLIFHCHRVTIFKRLSLVMSFVYFFRAICMPSTIFPLANLNYPCEPQLNGTVSFGQFIPIAFKRVGHMLLGFGLSINGFHNYCGDYLFSGHTLIITLGYLFLRQYLMPLRLKSITWKFLNGLLLVACIFAIICIMISRGHYLIDIILGYYASTQAFWSYHTIVSNPVLMLPSANNFLSNNWWFFIVRRFEKIPPLDEITREPEQCHLCRSEALYIVPRKFEVPFSGMFKRSRILCGDSSPV